MFKDHLDSYHLGEVLGKNLMSPKERGLGSRVWGFRVYRAEDIGSRA